MNLQSIYLELSTLLGNSNLHPLSTAWLLISAQSLAIIGYFLLSFLDPCPVYAQLCSYQYFEENYTRLSGLLSWSPHLSGICVPRKTPMWTWSCASFLSGNMSRKSFQSWFFFSDFPHVFWRITPIQVSLSCLVSEALALRFFQSFPGDSKV